jgi:prephenate dehydrogenase
MRGCSTPLLPSCRPHHPESGRLPVPSGCSILEDFRIGKLVVVGVGLIGGSLAAALKRENIVDRVVGVGRSRANVERALSLGVIDAAADDVAAAASDADIVLVAVPVGQTAGVIEQLRGALDNGAVVTDAGSTKRDFVMLARALLGGAPAKDGVGHNAFGTDVLGNIVPGHPIAGAERTGVDAASAALFVGKRVVLTPTPETNNAAVDMVETMWRACGADVIRMSAEHHDSVFSAVSHLPHVLSFALVEMIAARGNAEELFSFAASGFRDFTRIAGSSPEMWRDICATNGDQIVSDIEAFQQALATLADHIRAGEGDSVEKIFAAAVRARQAWIDSLK